MSFSRWVCVYPAYVNARLGVKQGRRIGKDKACDNPTVQELYTVAQSLGVPCSLEAGKVYSRTQDSMNRGRIRVQLYHERDDENVLDNVNRPLNPDLRTRKQLYVALSAGIQKLPSRGQKEQKPTSSSSAATSSSSTIDKPQKKRGKKDRR